MRTVFITLLCFYSFSIGAQEKNLFSKFGKITAEELQKKVYPIDSNANAVVLSEKLC